MEQKSGSKEYETMENCQDKFIKLSGLILDWNIPSYTVRKEINRQFLRIETGKRIVSFEEKLGRNQTKIY